MSNGYGQYCPLSLAAELLCQRWTILVISRLMAGCHRFNEIQRGLPQMSPSLLTKRLRELERYGLLEPKDGPGGRWREYHLTPAGEALEPLVQTMAVWGQHWARDMEIEDLDPAFLIWSMHGRIDTEALPPGRTVIWFSFGGAPSEFSHFWLVCTEDRVEMCLKDPGHDVDLRVWADLRVFVECWRGIRDVRTEIRSKRIRLSGPDTLKEQFPDWLQLHVLAGVPRLRTGPERDLRLGTGRGRS